MKRNHGCGIRKRMICWVMLTLALPALMFSLLYLSGLGGEYVQQRVIRNAKRSLRQFSEEGIYPRLLDADDPSAQLDNFTDMLIVQESMFMDTCKDPASVITNPYYSEQHDPNEENQQLRFLSTAIENGVANSSYNRYYVGMRMFIRPLLALLPYQQIRGILATFFFAMMAATLIVMYRECGVWAAAALMIGLLIMNLPILTSCIQFIFIFYVLFAALIAMPYVRRRARNGSWIAQYFFVIGAMTQFFDYYTIPVVTLTVPTLFLLLMNNRRQSSLQIAIRALLGWISGYGLMWIIKLVIASWVMGANQFSVAMHQFTTWTGITNIESLSGFTVPNVLYLVLRTTLSFKNLPIIAVSIAIYGVALVRARRRRLPVQRPDWMIFAVALLPFMWLIAAHRATGNHYFYQYRLLLGSIVGIFAFFASMFINPRQEN